MFKRRHVVTVVLGFLLLASGLAKAQQQSAVRPVATVRQVMEVFTIPASDAIFAVSEAPKTDAEWQTIERQALVLAESGNLLLIGSRMKDTGAWAKAARELVDAAAGVAAAARDKKIDPLLEASDKVAETCVTCHATYLPKAE